MSHVCCGWQYDASSVAIPPNLAELFSTSVVIENVPDAPGPSRPSNQSQRIEYKGRTAPCEGCDDGRIRADVR